MLRSLLARRKDSGFLLWTILRPRTLSHRLLVCPRNDAPTKATGSQTNAKPNRTTSPAFWEPERNTTTQLFRTTSKRSSTLRCFQEWPQVLFFVFVLIQTSSPSFFGQLKRVPHANNKPNKPKEPRLASTSWSMDRAGCTSSRRTFSTRRTLPG